MSGFHETRLPPKYAFGSSSGPGWKTQITELDSGHEERVIRWATYRERFELLQDVKDIDEINELLRFFKARQGAAYGFRVKNQWDWSSNAEGTDAPGTQDVQIEQGDGTTVAFQLIKKYTDGLSTVSKNIYKPVADTVRIWVNGVEKTEGVDWTVDTTTGIVTFSVAPGAGLAIHASFEFDTPARATSDIDEWLSASRRDVEEGELPSITLIEILDPSPPYTDFPYMGSIEVSISGNYTLSTGVARTFVISASNTGLKIILPDPANIPDGGPIFRVFLEGSNSAEIVDKDLVSLSPAMTLTPGTGCEVDLEDNSGTKIWYAY